MKILGIEVIDLYLWYSLSVLGTFLTVLLLARVRKDFPVEDGRQVTIIGLAIFTPIVNVLYGTLCLMYLVPAWRKRK
jgi:hypothetical protein